MLTVRFMVNFYYVVVCGWAIFYMCAGFQKHLPWASCLDGDQLPTNDSSIEMADWHTPDCFSQKLEKHCQNNYNDTTFYDGKCTSYDVFCKAHNYNNSDGIHCDENTTVANVHTKNSIYPSEDYLNGFVLGYTIPGTSGDKHSWSDYGSLSWELSLCLLLSWILICVSMIKGLQSYGKVAYVITLSPYFVLTALLAYVATLPGAKDGIEFFLTPDWEKLTVSQKLINVS